MNCGLIIACGKLERMGANADNAFLSLGTKPVLAYSLGVFEECDAIDSIVIVVRRDRLDAAQSLARLYGCSKFVKAVAGSSDWLGAVKKGLDVMEPEVKLVIIHDAGRPCVSVSLVEDTVKAAKRYGSGVAAVKVSEPVKRVERGLTVSEHLDPGKLWEVQTPQAFKLDVLKQALEAQPDAGGDASLALHENGTPVHLVESARANMKLTSPDDLALVTAVVAE